MKILNIYSQLTDIQQFPIHLNESSKKTLHTIYQNFKKILETCTTKKDYSVSHKPAILTKGELFDDIPTKIKHNIIESQQNKMASTVIYSWKTMKDANEYSIELHIYYGIDKSNTNQHNHIKYVNKTKLNNYYFIVRSVMELLIQQSHSKLTQHKINIYIYLTKNIKQIPDKHNETVDRIHVNTGITTFCSAHTEINIFRAEEWFKTFIHESIHNICLDFGSVDTQSYKKKLQDIFFIQSDYLLFETYTELWAEILQIVCISVFNNKDTVISDLHKECVFTVFQANKVLSLCTQMKGKYKDLTNKNKSILSLYRENTNCFSYYVLKMIAFCHINTFISWCVQYNTRNVLFFEKKNENVISFIAFFEKNYKDKTMIQYIESMYNTFEIITKDNAFMYKTLRMSIFEIII